jgi:Tol biopolymer transport system component
MAGNSVTAVENGRVRARSLDGSRAQQTAVVSINYGHLDYTVNGRTVTLDPQGRGSYLWPALSPDGTKVVYYLAGRGCFVCDVDGTNIRRLGMLRGAKWLNNEIVVGMNDVDNGEFVTSSSIIASDLQGQRQTLTADDTIAMYPSASADGKNIAYVTPEGRVFIINLK